MRIAFFKNGTKRNYTIIQPPTGTIVAYAGSSAPTNWLLCDGTAYSQSAYANLYAALGGATSPYGVSGGNFNVPDLRGKAPIGAGTGTGLSARTLGATVGASTTTLTGQQSGFPLHKHDITENNHTHNVTADSHSHIFYEHIRGGAGNAKSGGDNMSYFNDYNQTGLDTILTSGVVSGNQGTINYQSSNITDGSGNANVVGYTGHTNAVSPHSNAQPSLVVSYIIKT